MKSSPSSVPSESVLSFRIRLLGRSAFPDILCRNLAVGLVMLTAGIRSMLAKRCGTAVWVSRSEIGGRWCVKL